MKPNRQNYQNNRSQMPTTNHNQPQYPYQPYPPPSSPYWPQPHYQYPPIYYDPNRMGPINPNQPRTYFPQPQIPHNEKIYATNQSKEQKKREENNYKRNQIQDDFQVECSGSSEQEQEQQEALYVKHRAVQKKKDPILDSPEQIKKWISARKKNYPSTNKSGKSIIEASEMSILEKKIRQKIMFITSDGRGVLKKLRNMDILKRIISHPQPQKKVKKIKKAPKKIQLKQASDHSESQNENVAEEPIRKTEGIVEEPNPETVNKEKQQRRSLLQPEQMIEHLKEKQAQDRQFYQNIMNYKENSLNFKYASQTLEVNFLLEDIFKESSQILQAIRFFVKNDFFKE